MKRFAVTTLGCKVNQYDGCAVSSALSRAGLCPAQGGQTPDLLVINTCCVTNEAMRKSRQAIRRAVRGAPHAAVMVLGCYSDYDAARIHRLLGTLSVPPHRALVAGHHDNLADLIGLLLGSLSAQSSCTQHPFWARDDARRRAGGYDVSMSATDSAGAVALAGTSFIRARRLAAVKRISPGTRGLGPIDAFAGRDRAFVKVQDGCDAFCAYCIVPFTRACLWSRSVEEIVAECRALVAAGHREVVLSGVFLGAYGRATAVRKRWGPEPSRLPELLGAVAQVDGLWRVRLSSLEPGDLDEALLSAFRRLPNVAPHLHLPLQSGSEPILRAMNRQYSAEEYRRTVDRVRAALDRPAITTDVIVGFPGESDDDFDATLELVRHAGFAKVHAFRFSAVEGTAAWARRHEAPPPHVVRARMARLAEAERRTAGAFRRLFVGQELEAVVVSPRRADGPQRRAMADRYLTVLFPPPPDLLPEALTGQVVRVKIQQATDAGLQGQLVAWES